MTPALIQGGFWKRPSLYVVRPCLDAHPALALALPPTSNLGFPALGLIRRGAQLKLAIYRQRSLMHLLLTRDADSVQPTPREQEPVWTGPTGND